MPFFHFKTLPFVLLTPYFPEKVLTYEPTIFDQSQPEAQLEAVATVISVTAAQLSAVGTALPAVPQDDLYSLWVDYDSNPQDGHLVVDAPHRTFKIDVAGNIFDVKLKDTP